MRLRYLLRFSKTRELWSSKAAFANGRFSLLSIVIRMTSNEPWNTNTQNGSKSTYHKSKTMTFWIRWSKLLFFLRARLRWLTAEKNANVSWLFKLQNSGVYEKRSERLKLFSMLMQRWWLKLENDEYLKHFFFLHQVQKEQYLNYRRAYFKDTTDVFSSVSKDLLKTSEHIVHVVV